MEVGSFGGPDKNRVYGLSNTTVKNLRSARSVSTVGISSSVSRTHSEEFMALKQQYEWLLMDYDQLREMVMEIRSRMGDDTCATPLAVRSREQPGSSSSSSSSAIILV
jgi:hypothetical protein